VIQLLPLLSVHTRDSLQILAEAFSEIILEDQRCFDSKDGWETLLRLIPDNTVVAGLREKWVDEAQKSSWDKWKDFKKIVQKSDKESASGVNGMRLTYLLCTILTIARRGSFVLR
jgi:DNA primase catalytic subunit